MKSQDKAIEARISCSGLYLGLFFGGGGGGEGGQGSGFRVLSRIIIYQEHVC